MNDDLKNRLSLLVDSFSKNENVICSSSSDYNEAELRNDFLNEFFSIFGWDVSNRKGLPKPLREVVLEANVNVESETKKPDYEFRFNGNRKFYVEAKKPSVDILSSKKPAFQTRRYGWSAKLPISILTNFKNLVIYDCSYMPNAEDSPHSYTIKQYNYKEFIDNFDEIYSLISKESVTSGSFDANFGNLIESKRGEFPFDDFFLEQIEKWRLQLAHDMITLNSKLSEEELNYLIQVFINRIVFLRICEDRNLEPYGALKSLKQDEAISSLMTLFYEADKKYDSGLFNFIKDKLSPSIVISNEVLLEIVNDLYYPISPYTFSVVDPQVLGNIYEHFISKSITLDNFEPTISIKPETRAANGVFSTPPSIVAKIVKETFDEYLTTNEKINDISVADTSCGSGVFLLEAYEQLLTKYLEYYISESRFENLRKDDSGDYLLSLEAKKTILLDHIFGVDIDEQAVEVAKFSLLLKVLEEVPNGEISHILEKGEKALPSLENNIKCGNSLIGEEYFKKKYKDMGSSIMKNIKPFSWKDSFGQVFQKGGFNIIIGNPPYTKIQNLTQYSPIESEFYKTSSPYVSSRADNFDKYHLFIERSVELLADDGVLGYIIPHKFMVTRAGQAIRKIIATNGYLRKIIHFGTLQVFGNRSTTYSCILLLRKQSVKNNPFSFEKVDDLQKWQSAAGDDSVILESNTLSDLPWTFPTKKEKECFDKIEISDIKLKTVAEIFVGLQTSADQVFIIDPKFTNDTTVGFEDKNGKKWEVEKTILKQGILDTTVDCFLKIVPNKLIIFPYKKINGEFKVIPETELQDSFPEAYKYLSANKNLLTKRDLSRNTLWYQYGRPQSLNKFNNDKLIIKNPSLKANATYDDEQILFTGGGNGPYYGIRPLNNFSIYLLLALINHPLFDRWVKLRSSVFRGGYYSFGKQFIENYPISKLILEKNNDVTNKVVELWEKITLLNQEKCRTPEQSKQNLNQKKMLKNAADEAIFKLYEIDPSVIQEQVSNEE